MDYSSAKERMKLVTLKEARLMTRWLVMYAPEAKKFRFWSQSSAELMLLALLLA